MRKYDFRDGRGYVGAIVHPNGGGLVAITAHVEPSVYLAKGVEVFGHAKLTGNVRVSGRVRISGDYFPCGMSTLIEDDVTISGEVVIEGFVLLRDRVSVRDRAQLRGAVRAMHSVVVCQNARLSGDITLRDKVFVGGDACLLAHDETIELSGDQWIMAAAGSQPASPALRRSRRIPVRQEPVAA